MHVAVPLQLCVTHGVLVQVTAVPPHAPVPPHTSPCVHAFASSQAAPALIVSVQLEVPLHARAAQVVLVQVTAVPAQLPPAPQMSLYVQAFPSSQRAAGRHAHVPPSLVHQCGIPPQASCWQSTWLVASHTCAPPPPQIPTPPAAPHPLQVCPIVNRFASQVSVHAPGAVLHPVPPAHVP